MAILTVLAAGALLFGHTPPVPAAPVQAPKLKITDVKVGTGEGVERGDQVSVIYVGKFTDGKTFDDSKGKPFIFVVGLHYVIPGWEKGLIGMKVGGERNLVIPPELAYGNRQGIPIPPNSTLLFNVKLTKIVHVKSALKIKVIEPGTGPGATWDDSIAVDYAGSLTNGKEFDSSFKRGQPISVTIGVTRLIPGFTVGLLGIKVGETRTITIPAEFAYGTRSPGPEIPANSDLVFKLTRVKPKS